MVPWFISYWFLHSVGQVARMIPAAMVSLNGMLPFLVEATAGALSLSIGSRAIYLFRVSQRLAWFPKVMIEKDFLKLLITYAFCRSATSPWNTMSLWNIMQSSSNLEVFMQSPLCSCHSIPSRDPCYVLRRQSCPIELGACLLVAGGIGCSRLQSPYHVQPLLPRVLY